MAIVASFSFYVRVKPDVEEFIFYISGDLCIFKSK